MQGMKFISPFLLLSFLFSLSLWPATPVPYSGKIDIRGVNYFGEAQFAFSLHDGNGTTHWRNGNQPKETIKVTIRNGRYNVLLGGQGMNSLPPELFLNHDKLYLKVEFDNEDGEVLRHLAPDQLITATPRALVADIAKVAEVAHVAETVGNGAITRDMLSPDILDDLNATIEKSRLSPNILSDINRTITYDRLAPSAIHAISSTSLSSITDGKIKVVPFGQTPPSGYSLYHRGKAENLNWEFISDSGHWSGINRSVLTSDRLISFSNSIREKYPIDSNWITIKSTESGHGHAANSYMGKVYITGGVNDNVSTNKVRVYDISTEIFSVGNSLPIPIRNHSAIVFNDNLFVIGGLRGGTGQKSTFRYNFTNDEWDEKKSLNFNRTSSSTDIYGDRIWITGGYASMNVLNSVESYDLTDNKWHIESTMNVAREFHSSWVYKNRLFVAGGKDGNKSLDTIECYDPNLKTWYEWGKLPNSIHSSAAFVVKDILYIFSGDGLKGTLKLDLTNSTSHLSDIYIQDLNSTNPLQAEVADGSVTGSKMADGSVTASKIASNAITTNELNEQILKYLKPEITIQPQAKAVYADSNVSFSVTAEGKHLTYQWKKDGSNLTGETNATFIITDANSTPHDGNYSVVVSNDFGSDESNVTTFIVVNDINAISGLVGWWKFDETNGTIANDSSGYERHANMLGFDSNQSCWTSGKIGGSLTFDGVNDYAEVQGFYGINGQNPRTISAWIKTDSNNSTIMGWGRSSAGKEWKLSISDGNFRTSVWSGWVYGSNAADVNDWVYIASILPSEASVSSQIMHNFNGNLEILEIQEYSIFTGEDYTVKIGSSMNAGGKMNGAIDDLRLYDRALSAAEVQALYNLGQ